MYTLIVVALLETGPIPIHQVNLPSQSECHKVMATIAAAQDYPSSAVLICMGPNGEFESLRLRKKEDETPILPIPKKKRSFGDPSVPYKEI